MLKKLAVISLAAGALVLVAPTVATAAPTVPAASSDSYPTPPGAKVGDPIIDICEVSTIVFGSGYFPGVRERQRVGVRLQRRQGRRLRQHRRRRRKPDPPRSVRRPTVRAPTPSPSTARVRTPPRSRFRTATMRPPAATTIPGLRARDRSCRSPVAASSWPSPAEACRPGSSAAEQQLWSPVEPSSRWEHRAASAPRSGCRLVRWSTGRR